MTKKAVLLINLGTPDNFQPQSVRRYLREFLNDPRVIDLPAWIRWPLVNLMIIPKRLQTTASAYQKIWGDKGSPLLDNSVKMQEALTKELSQDYHVELAMRYGKPDIFSALEKLKNFDSIVVLPLYPQYSSSATGSAIEDVLSKAAKQWNIPSLIIKHDFYDNPNFIDAFANQIQTHTTNKKVDKLIFSYHGLPERHIIKSDCRAACDRVNACPVVSSENRFCYRAQCYATTELIVNSLGLASDQYMVSFQSRLGRTPWIKPYTDLVLPELIKQGVKRIAMVSPSFVADCLETLEEINIRTREQWLALGGEDFTFIPCVNDNPLWIKSLADIVKSN